MSWPSDFSFEFGVAVAPQSQVSLISSQAEKLYEEGQLVRPILIRYTWSSQRTDTTECSHCVEFNPQVSTLTNPSTSSVYPLFSLGGVMTFYLTLDFGWKELGSICLLLSFCLFFKLIFVNQILRGNFFTGFKFLL